MKHHDASHRVVLVLCIVVCLISWSGVCDPYNAYGCVFDTTTCLNGNNGTIDWPGTWQFIGNDNRNAYCSHLGFTIRNWDPSHVLPARTYGIVRAVPPPPQGTRRCSVVGLMGASMFTFDKTQMDEATVVVDVSEDGVNYVKFDRPTSRASKVDQYYIAPPEFGTIRYVRMMNAEMRRAIFVDGKVIADTLMVKGLTVLCI
jgi:hypothetical protein